MTFSTLWPLAKAHLLMCQYLPFWDVIGGEGKVDRLGEGWFQAHSLPCQHTNINQLDVVTCPVAVFPVEIQTLVSEE